MSAVVAKGGLASLEIASFRNIQHCALSPHPELNILCGPNASGKTSFLEAIHYLALGRSFRTPRAKALIKAGEAQTLLLAQLLGGAKVGLQKSRNGDQQLKLNGETVSGWERVAREIPVQLLDATTFSLLNEGPRLRRRFLDWGVFHVEQQFLPAWRRARKSVMQRNALLKQSGKPDEKQLEFWEAELASGAELVTRSREAYFQRLEQAFCSALGKLSGQLGSSVSLHFQAGWNTSQDLGKLLFDGRENDKRLGVTRHGPPSRRYPDQVRE